MTEDELTPTSPSSPLMGTSPLSDPPELVTPEPDSEPEDIDDPPVPETLTKSLQQNRETKKKANVSPPVAQEAPAEPVQPTLPDNFGEHEALFRGVAQHIINKITDGLAEASRGAHKSVDDMYSHVSALIHEDQQRLRHAETLLDQLATKIAQEGILVRADPYQLTVQALAPHGYPISMRLAGPTMAETLQDTARFIDWLVTNGFKPA